MDLNKLTENAQKAVASAQAEAAKQGHQAVEVEHLLHALATQEDGLIPRLLEKLGAQPARFAERLESEIARLPKVSGPGTSPGGVYVTPRLQSLLGRAAEAADHTVLLDDGHDAKPLEGVAKQRLIERLDGVHAHDVGGDAVEHEQLRRLEGGSRHRAHAEQADVGAIAHHESAADLELRRLLVNRRLPLFSQPNVGRPWE